LADQPIVLRLRCDAVGRCAGSYYYERIGKTLDLVQVGQVGEGRFDESVGVRARAQVTGHLVLDGPPGANPWRGTWTAATPGPSSAAVQPIVLTTVSRGGPPRWHKRACVEHSAKNPDCHVKVTSFELLGLPDAEMEERLNAAFAPQAQALEMLPDAGSEAEACAPKGTACDDSPHGYRLLCRRFGTTGEAFGPFDLEDETRPTLLDDTLLSVRKEYWFDLGGMHPSDGVAGVTVDLSTGRALGAGDFLTTPARPPNWAALVPPAQRELPDAFEVPFTLAATPAPKPVWEKVPWDESYLTDSSFAFVPQVPEVARAIRHQVREVPFARVRGALRRDGPLAHLVGLTAADAGIPAP